MNRFVVSGIVTLFVGLAGGIALDRYTPARAENPTSLPVLAEKIRKGQIDVGKEYGVAPDSRYHKIHAEVLALECAACHAEKFPAGTEIFAVPPAVDVSQDSPGPIDRRSCLGCHIGGAAFKAYGP